MGWRMGKPDIATPAGVKQAYPLHPRAPPAHEMVHKSNQRSGIYGYRQRAAVAMAEGDREDGRALVCV